MSVPDGPFHIAIHASAVEGHALAVPTNWHGQSAEALSIEPAALHTPFEVTFETVLQRLNRLPRMFIEPDGSFVWVAEEGTTAWQLDGLLFDRDQRLLYLELKGGCTHAAWRTLLAALGWPGTEVVIQSIPEALFFSEREFSRLYFSRPT